MNKWYGIVGYVETKEDEPDVWVEDKTERSYYGELVRNSGKFQTSGNVNDDRSVSAEISIISDPYAIQHFHSIRYVEFMGTKWEVTNAEPKYPRIILTLGGGVYNG